MNKALVICLISGEYTLYDLSTSKTLLAKPRGVFRNNQTTVKVGDIVYYEDGNPFATIVKVEPRKNDLVRPTIANIDQAIVVTSVKEPDLNLNLLDRFIAILEYNDIVPILVFNKIDLLDKDDNLDDTLDYYHKIGYQVFKTTTKEQHLIEKLKPLMANKISVITGQSGVGKSSILNILDEKYMLATNNISKALNRGKHTTRYTALLPFENGWVADSPGFGIIDFSDMTEVDLSHSFIEFFNAPNKCKFKGCLHLNEPSCEIKKLVEEKTILTSRYENYVQMINEIKIKRKW